LIAICSATYQVRTLQLRTLPSIRGIEFCFQQIRRRTDSKKQVFRTPYFIQLSSCTRYVELRLVTISNS